MVVAEERGKRLFIKNTGPCENVEVEVYGLTPARCWKVKRTRECIFVCARRRIEAPVNGGGNYNHPKVAKFLVG